MMSADWLKKLLTSSRWSISGNWCSLIGYKIQNLTEILNVKNVVTSSAWNALIEMLVPHVPNGMLSSRRVK